MYYGWWIVAAMFLSMGFQAGFFSYTFSLFVIPLQEAFNVGRAEVMGAMTFTTLVGLFVSPVLGQLIDRYPARVLSATGALLFGAGFWLMHIATELWHLILVFAVSQSIAAGLIGPMMGSAMVARWFEANRGKALGLATTGTSVGGMVMPLFVVDWISAGGWRHAMENLALVTLAVLLPVLVLVVRARPPTQAAKAGSGTLSAPAFTVAGLLRNPDFWGIGISVGLVMGVYAALLSNLAPYGTGIGMDGEGAARLITLVAVFGLIGKLVFGAAADKISLRVAMLITQALVLSAVSMMWWMPTPLMASAAAVILGLAAGGLLPVWSAMIASVFGVQNFGRVMGMMNPLIVLLVMPGFALTGYLYDLSGNYALSMMMFAGATAVAAVALAMTPLRAPEPLPA